ncbi:MAG TPA: RidA family protein [Tepidiformaceae bacterium]|nr:RidA family protein [Tepidiformaceae bacterium]
MTIAERLAELGLALPTTPTPMANYVPAVRSGNLVFVSGHGPRSDDGSFVAGKLGRDLSREEGYAAARLTMLNCLASLSAAAGGLDNVRRIVKVFGMVNCTEDFGEQPQVINGGSDLLVQIFGERGRHARSAVGMESLPNSIAVEIELIAEVG